MFRETLRYASPQKPGTTARYDGNISEITYTSYNGTPTPSSETYGYAYDGLKRLTDAVHYAGAATTQSLLKTEKNITYDRGGNITGLDRYGASGLSEMLSFTHAGNQLADSREGLQMEYNLLNLPREARHMNDTVSYRYLADGTKLSALTNVGDGLKYRGSLNLLDFGARHYAPGICRWTSIDRL